MKHILLLTSAVLLAGTVALSAQDRDPERTFEALKRRLDTDLDGKISESEFPRGRLAFRRLDRDKDGYLTKADFEGGPSKGTESPAAPKAPERAPTEQELQFFESKIRPVLASNCFECHSASAKKIKGGLRVDSREALLAGGSTGAAIVPGDVEESLLVQAVRRTDEELQMPPKKELATDVVKDIERWVEMGAPWPASSAPNSSSTGSSGAKSEKHTIDYEKARQFWAFQAPKHATPPATKDASWAWSPIDRFLLADMESKGVAPVADADKRTWLRRATFDLTGLPPAPEELDAFEKDKSPDAWAKAVDRLLASSAFGERWGRHWLDVARYAESSGKDTNVLYPHAWRYRDWVIAAFNRDMAYDQFVREQIAGDLVPSANDDERAEHEIATGYLTLGAKGHNTRDRRQFALDVADEQIDAMSQGMLGLTLACARCHDHKFDPVPTEDYYALAGILLSSETRYGTLRGPGNNAPSDLIELPEGAHVPNGPSMSPGLRAVLERTRDRVAGVAEEGMKTPGTGGGEEPEGRKPRRAKDDGGKPDGGKPDDGAVAKKGEDAKRPDVENLVHIRYARDQKNLLDDLLSRFDASGRALDSNRLAMGVVEARPHDIAVLERGELDKPGSVVKRGFPQVFAGSAQTGIAKGSGRKELAEWIASKDNPLTARVWVNRVWLHFFGRGIVSTPDNFGASGQRPDHPELLDWLATELVANGWSTKKLVREIVLSHAYRLASTSDERWMKIDPEAIALWRMPERRLEAEAIRDAMLSAAGTLRREPPIGSPVGVLEGAVQREEFLAQALQEQPVRSVYLPIVRDHLPDALDVFDAPDPSFVTGDREETNVATQALYLMNDENVLKDADAFAARLLAREGSDDERIAYAFELALGRKPTGSESSAVREFLREFEKSQSKPGHESKPSREPREPRDKGGRDRRVEDAPRASGDPHRDAWAAFALSLFQSAEFRFLG